MKTFQWTMLVGLLAMLVYVLYRMRASLQRRLAPGCCGLGRRGALWSNGVVDIHLSVVRAGEVKVSVHMGEHDAAVHEGALDVGVHTWNVAVPDDAERVVVRMACEGHRTERRLQRKG